MSAWIIVCLTSKFCAKPGFNEYPMQSGAFSLLVLVYYRRVRCISTAQAPILASGDYANFGDSGKMEHGVLEGQVLSLLYKGCSEYNCPEIKRDIFDERLQGTNFEDKARHVILSVFGRAKQSKLNEQLLAEFGYAGRLLLRRLFADPSVEKLAKKLTASDSTGTRREFCHVARYHRAGLKRIHQALEERAAGESEKDLLRLAENGGGQDLAIHTFKAMASSEAVTLSSVFTELVDSWSDDPGRRGKLLPVVIDFLQIVLELHPQCSDGQVKLRESIVEHVYASCDTKRECFELFRGFRQHRFLLPTVRGYINKELKGDASPGFVRKYIAYVQQYYADPKLSAYAFFRGLWPSMAAFHVADIEWRSDPGRFNLISAKWLRDMFTDLYRRSSKDRAMVELVGAYMDVLDYDVFIDIVKWMKVEECRKLGTFMLEHQRPTARDVYQQRYRENSKYSRIEGRHRHALDVLGDVFRRLAAGQPVSDRGSRGMCSAG
ncbi:hypothetical protein PAPHI01_0971 [Pancytospora philotis]|nr:hypothetical protein PAPHI01_0971 [Pancytospora philotis]